MAAGKNPRAARHVEPAACQGAAAPMSAQLLSEAPPPRRAAPVAAASQGEAAFEAWLRRELGRLYDATLTEPVPEELARLVNPPPGKAATRRR